MKTHRGFTLIEMLAALVILALSLSIFMAAFVQSLKSLKQVRTSERSYVAGLSILESVENDRLAIGRQQGEWDGLRWTLDVSAVSPQEPVTLLRLDLTISDSGSPVELSTLRAVQGRVQ